MPVRSRPRARWPSRHEVAPDARESLDASGGQGRRRGHPRSLSRLYRDVGLVDAVGGVRLEDGLVAALDEARDLDAVSASELEQVGELVWAGELERLGGQLMGWHRRCVNACSISTAEACTATGRNRRTRRTSRDRLAPGRPALSAREMGSGVPRRKLGHEADGPARRAYTTCPGGGHRRDARTRPLHDPRPCRLLSRERRKPRECRAFCGARPTGFEPVTFGSVALWNLLVWHCTSGANHVVEPDQRLATSACFGLFRHRGHDPSTTPGSATRTPRPRR